MKTQPRRSVEYLRARDAMSSPAIACREEMRLDEVAELLADREVSGLPVVDADGRVTGVISERDIAHALGGPLIRLAIRKPVHTGSFLRLPHAPAHVRLARDAMTRPPTLVDADAPLTDVARAMVTQRINRVPVVEHGSLVGIVTRDDILAAMAHLTKHESSETRPPIVLGSGVAVAALPTRPSRRSIPRYR